MADEYLYYAIIRQNFIGFFRVHYALILAFTASAESASPPAADAIEEEKKYFSSNIPLGVEIYLLLVTRLTVLSCMSIADATSRRTSGLRYCTPNLKSCLADLLSLKLPLLLLLLSDAETLQASWLIEYIRLNTLFLA